MPAGTKAGGPRRRAIVGLSMIIRIFQKIISAPRPEFRHPLTPRRGGFAASPLQKVSFTNTSSNGFLPALGSNAFASSCFPIAISITTS
ncbi:MAG: hypothetical protein BWY28_00918 [bacterium ADurb.Bin236]|nr:MAG: hypothetical protein BWY28_00918 [bacterium ADurb.Bin236]